MAKKLRASKYEEALKRADKLIECFSKQIANLCLYDGGYADLNEHFIFMGQNRLREDGKAKG